MNTNKVSLEKTGLRYGIYGGIAMIVYFLILKLIGLDGNDTLRFLNHILIAVAVCMAIFYYTRHQEKGMRYLRGLGIGFIVGLVSAVTYGIFMFLYSYFIDQDFTADLRIQDFYGSNLSPLMLFGVTMLMGMIVGAFVGYITMMYFDRSKTETSDF
jgi:hypothetical protein